ncbi:MAG: YidC/Oxa1 family membrane protein insertase [Deltaproteobacteria bacterium]|nr:YidC/Oxa1 family membrane protein insertase [Deltaproteobacteria bacterium]
MSDFFYTVFIYPLEFLMKCVMETVLNNTGDPILSLVAVSAFVSIGSLPLYHIAEKWQDNERAIQEKLQPKIREFKSVFKGASLNAYIQTLYRQNEYHPVMAIRAVLGILIQIPFFIAAYHLLSEYPAFEGVSAIFFNDLGRPDGLIKLGSLSINVLPFLMTGVNILSAVIYGKKLGTKEKIQTYGIAGVFLVALYSSPASLLFYWTSNNIFSLAKNGIYRLIYPDGRIKSTQQNETRIWPIFLRISALRPSTWGQITLFVLTLALYLIAPEFTKPNSETQGQLYGLIYTVLLMLGGLTIAGALANKTMRRSARNTTAAVYGIVVLISLGLQLVWMLNVVPDVKFTQYAANSLFALMFFNGARSVFALWSNWIAKNELEVTTRPGTLFALAVLTLLTTIFIAVPLPLVSTASVGDFEKSLSYYLFFMLMLVVSFFILSCVVYSYLSRASRSLLIYIISFLAILSLVNAFVFAGEYGDMSNFNFENGLPEEPVAKIVNMFVLIIIGGGLILLFLKRLYKWLLPVWIICLLSIGVVTVSESHRFYQKSQKISLKFAQASQLDKQFVFSRTQPNVLVIMLDRFVGGMVPKAFELAPVLKSQFEGFTWYPQYFSDGAFTILGVPSLMGGWEYHTKEVQYTRTTMPLKQKLDESARVLPYNFNKAGYQTTVFADLEAYFDPENRKYIERTKFASLKAQYKDLWLQEHQKKLKEDNVRGKLAIFGLFRTAPPILRNYIYDNGDWLLGSKAKNTDMGNKSIIGDKQVSFLTTNDAQINRAVEGFSTLYFLPRLSATSDKAHKQFYYFSNAFTHEPVIANANFDLSVHERIFYPRDVYDEFDESMYTLQHLYTDTTALVAIGKWFEWMKQNDVYDNTKIIVVSDHGRNVYDPVLKSQKIISSLNAKKPDASWFHGLLMVKDFGQKGAMRKSNQFLTTCDVPWLTMKDIVTNPINPTSKKKIVFNADRYPFSMFFTPPMIWQQTKYKYKVKDIFEIQRKNDVLDPAKWKRVNVK